MIWKYSGPYPKLIFNLTNICFVFFFLLKQQNFKDINQNSTLQVNCVKNQKNWREQTGWCRGVRFNNLKMRTNIRTELVGWVRFQSVQFFVEIENWTEITIRFG